MLQQLLVDLRDYILKFNTYFSVGYEAVYIDPNIGIVNNGKTFAFPDDTIGSYFYLRLPNQTAYSQQKEYTISDNVSGLGMSMEVYLVAYVKDSDADKLLLNLISTLRYYGDLRINRATNQSDVVVTQELAKTDKKIIMAALQRIPKNASIVSINFTINKPVEFIYPNCITTPCGC